MVESLFTDKQRDIRWLSTYCDILMCALTSKKGKAADDTRSKQYCDYLQNTLIPDFKKRITAKQPPNQSEIWADLVDIYKIVTALFAFFAGGNFSLDIKYIDMTALEGMLRSNSVTVNQGGPVLQLPVKTLNAYSAKDRQYAVLLSWIIMAMICEQDGIEAVN